MFPLLRTPPVAIFCMGLLKSVMQTVRLLASLKPQMAFPELTSMK